MGCFKFRDHVSGWTAPRSFHADQGSWRRGSVTQDAQRGWGRWLRRRRSTWGSISVMALISGAATRFLDTALTGSPVPSSRSTRSKPRSTSRSPGKRIAPLRRKRRGHHASGLAPGILRPSSRYVAADGSSRALEAKDNTAPSSAGWPTLDMVAVATTERIPNALPLQ